MKKFVSSLCALGFVVASFGAVSAEFTDSGVEFYADHVDYLAEKGIVQGYDDGSFGYDLSVNRAEMLKILIVGRFNPDQSEELAPWNEYAVESCFEDVPANQWYTEYICYAKALGWIGGYDDNTFRPAQEVNFVEAMKILLEIFDIGYDATTEPWYKGLVEVAAENNLTPLTVTAFGQKITREEMSSMASVALGIFADCDEGVVADEEVCVAYEFYKDYVMTYEMIEMGDSFLEKVEESVEEPGLSVHVSLEALVKSDCGGYKCFNEKFKACEVSNVNMDMFFISYNYEILGMEDGLCKMKSYYDVHPQEEWVGKEMICGLDNSKDFEIASEEVLQDVLDIGVSEVCEGELLDLYIDLVPGESCDDENGTGPDGTKINLGDDGAIECVDGEWVDCPDCFETGESCEHAGGTYGDGEALSLGDWGPNECIDGEWVDCPDCFDWMD
jgi:hypothetical protein